LLERFYLEGAAYRYKEVRRESRPDWDLASIAAPDAALLFALDLDYEAHPTEKLFRFGPPRTARFEFDLPPHLRELRDVFRIDADRTYDVVYERAGGGVCIEDRVSKVAIYVAALDRDLRERLQGQRIELVQYERSFQFDPAHVEEDFAAVSAFLRMP